MTALVASGYRVYAINPMAVARYRGRLVGDDAEDAVQDCLLKAYRGYGRLESPSASPKCKQRVSWV